MNAVATLSIGIEQGISNNEIKTRIMELNNNNEETFTNSISSQLRTSLFLHYSIFLKLI